MFMRIAFAKLVPGGFESYQEAFQRLYVPATGLRSRYLVRDVNDPDATYGIAIWDDLVAMREWERSDYYENVLKPGLRPFLDGAYSVSLCEVCDVMGA